MPGAMNQQPRGPLENLGIQVQLMQDGLNNFLRPMKGLLMQHSGIHSHLQQQIDLKKQQMLYRRPPFAAVSTSSPDAPKKKRKKKRPRPTETELARDGIGEEAPATPNIESQPKPKKQSWFPWQKKETNQEQQSDAAQSSTEGDSVSADRKQSRGFLPWLWKDHGEIKHPPVEESDFVRSLDEVPPPTPQNDLERSILEIEAIRPYLNAEENEELDQRLYEKMAQAGLFKLEDDEGNEVSLKRYIKKAAYAEERRQMDADEPQIQKISHEEKMDRIHGSQLRQNKNKMWLRPDEEDELELDQFGIGNVFSPRKFLGQKIGLLHDFAFGIFGRIPETCDSLTDKWAGRDPYKVLTNQKFYDDIIYYAPKSELTILMVAHRPLPLLELRNKFLDRHAMIASKKPFSDESQPLSDSAKQMMANIKKRWTVENLQHSGLIDKKGRVIPGSQLILTCGIHGQLSAEAITAGTLAEKATVPITTWHDPFFTCNIFEHFLGRQPVCLEAKERIGNGALWVANGFDFRPPEQQESPYVTYASNSPDIPSVYRQASAIEGVKNCPDMFSIAELGEQPMLLDSREAIFRSNIND